jgi:hypothetical protein
MKSKTSAARALSLLLLVSGTCALAQGRPPQHLSGLINDYVPQLPSVKGSPYEMHGQWSMDIHPEWASADFIVDMTMSSFGKTAAGAVDPTQPLVNPHTHHIKLTDMRIKWDMTGCPAWGTPTLQGFQLNGTVSLATGNGTNGSFETDPPTSTLQVCITGGADIKYSIENSNITMVFGGPATTHFGPQAIHGVVRKPANDEIKKNW